MRSESRELLWARGRRRWSVRMDAARGRGRGAVPESGWVAPGAGRRRPGSRNISEFRSLFPPQLRACIVYNGRGTGCPMASDPLRRGRCDEVPHMSKCPVSAGSKYLVTAAATSPTCPCNGQADLEPRIIRCSCCDASFRRHNAWQKPKQRCIMRYDDR